MAELHSIEINRPASVVFPLVSEPQNHLKWSEPVKKVEMLTNGTTGAGMKFRVTHVATNNTTTELINEVTAYEPNKRLTIQQTTEAFDTLADYQFSEVNGRTRLDLSLDSTYHLEKFPLLLRLFVRVMSPIVHRIARNQIEKDLATLKALAER